MSKLFRPGISDPWDDVLITHRDVVDRLPAGIRDDFLPPNPFAAVGISSADLERWAAPTRAELAAGVAYPGYAVGGYIA